LFQNSHEKICYLSYCHFKPLLELNTHRRSTLPASGKVINSLSIELLPKEDNTPERSMHRRDCMYSGRGFFSLPMTRCLGEVRGRSKMAACAGLATRQSSHLRSFRACRSRIFAHCSDPRILFRGTVYLSTYRMMSSVHD
jgi:hypothetical protein